MPPPSLSLYGLALGLALRMRVSVKVMTVSPACPITDKTSRRDTVIDTVNFSAASDRRANVQQVTAGNTF